MPIGLNLEMDRIVLRSAERSAPGAAPALPESAEGGEKLWIRGVEVERSPVVVHRASGRCDRVRMFTAEVSVVELLLFLEAAIARRQLEVGIVLLTELEEELPSVRDLRVNASPGSHVRG